MSDSAMIQRIAAKAASKQASESLFLTLDERGELLVAYDFRVVFPEDLGNTLFSLKREAGALAEHLDSQGVSAMTTLVPFMRAHEGMVRLAILVRISGNVPKLSHYLSNYKAIPFKE